jgi:dTDP-4-dehydrorhamnose reductase
MADKTILVAGGAGQVARALVDMTAPDGVRIVARGRPDLDVLDTSSIARAMDDVRPHFVVNAAAYTAVDQAEGDEAAAFALNAEAPGHLAAAASVAGVPIIHLSTDYVFDGSKNEPYVETDPVAPLGVYGRSKLAGEEAVASANADHIILRTAWVYSPVGKNFVKIMLRVSAGRDELGVVDDQRGNPTSAADIADGIVRVAAQILSGAVPAKPGVYHMTSGGEASWADFAQYIFDCSAEFGGPVASVKRITSAEYPTPVRRPASSRLNSSKLAAVYDVELPHWQGSTRNCVEKLVISGEWNS